MLVAVSWYRRRKDLTIQGWGGASGLQSTAGV